MNPAVVRGVGVMLPIALVALAVLLRPVRLTGGAARDGQARLAGALLATGWNVMVLGPLNATGLWWSFQAEGGVVAGVPVDLLLGWALLWGALPALAFPLAPMPLVAAGLAWADLALMPLAEPVVRLHDGWLVGETVAVAAGLVPGLLIARWTVQGRRLGVRAAAQVVLAAGLGLAIPVALSGVWRQPGWVLGLAVQALAVPGALGLAAVREFRDHGQGTALPYDPPRVLVTGGPYAYVRNPMQVAMTLGYLVIAVLDVRFLGAAALSFAYGAGLAAWHEGGQLARHDGWEAYRGRVRAWVPGTRPDMPPATVHVSATCGRCAPVAAWIERHEPVRLRVVPAETHPAGLRRITYTRGDGPPEQGVAALAHVFTHLHLGWAVLGWLLMIPGLTRFAQLAGDAFGAAPRDVRPPA
ncbi:isoprenylcysteine carboxylmethyltransferase family protein [Nonomuraea sp. NBC_01738]|uniref:methyltransferase family protein n=1 Tax=Nonomuraea sp. NBC_01738 TaxID=2976003 RepID=UPI002E0DE1EC|nr:isoprenylcysteine carboxylmethyltransferase family protein [Nonomuraea sp. NBC_01738]